MIRLLWILFGLAVGANTLHAQVPGLEDLMPKGDAVLSGRMIQLIALLTVLSIAPGLLIMVTSFTRFVVALSFLRTGMGLQSTPATDAVMKAKPSGAKGNYVKRVAISSTMGAGIKIDPSSLASA